MSSRGVIALQMARGVVISAMVGGLGSACRPVTFDYRSLHEVDATLVRSSPPPPVAYEAYLRARLALYAEPPRLAEAQQYIERAIGIDPREPHLWATRAQIEARAGQTEQARASAKRALVLRPGYRPAERILAGRPPKRRGD